MHTKEEATLIPGVKPVLEFLERHVEQVDTVYILRSKRSPDIGRILDLCRDKGVRFSLASKEQLDRTYPGAHQGCLARIFSAGFVEFETLAELGKQGAFPLILALDQVQDPGNAGTLARTLHGLGGTGLLLPRHNAAHLGAGAMKASAGSLGRLPIARVTNLGQALDKLEEDGYAVYAAHGGEEGADVYGVRFAKPAVLVLGNEDKGVRPGVSKRCREVVRIPLCADVDSLNVAQAGAVIMGEMFRQFRTLVS